MKNYDNKFGTPNDYYTTIDAEYLLKFLLNNKSKFGNKDCLLNDKAYKMKCIYNDVNNNQVEY